MIPLNTPPGTEIVCIVDPECVNGYVPPPIKKGCVYTISSWEPYLHDIVPYVSLDGVSCIFVFHPGCFRLLDLAGLDALLHVYEDAK